MITLGLVLLIVGILLGVPVLNTIGGILLVVGLILFALGLIGHTVGPRAHYY